MSLVDEEAKDEAGPLQPVAPLKDVKHLDDFIKFGGYTYFVLVVAEFLCLSTLSHMVYMVFSGANPTVTGCGDTVFNDSDTACAQLERLRNETGCTPKVDYQFYSVNVDFDYLCGESKHVKNSISLQMAFVLIGAFIFGQCSDIYGRRKVLIVALAGTAILTEITAYSPDLMYFTFLRCITGLFAGGVNSVQGVFMVENIPRKHRMLINTVITWSPNFIIFPVVAYFSYDWKTLSHVCAVINLLACITLIFCYESPRFIIQKGRIDEARRIISAIRRKNGDNCEKVAEEVEEMLEFLKANRRKKHTMYHILNTVTMFRWTATLCYGIMVTSLVNYGILFNMEKLSGSLYLNNIFFGIIRWIMNVSVGVMDYYYEALGRKLLNTVSEAFNIVALALVFVVYALSMHHEYANVVRLASLGVSAMCAQVYLAKFMTATELYPTAVRNLGCSALSISSRVGTIFGPILFYLGDMHLSLPYGTLAALVFIDSICFIVNLPETKNRKLENHLPPKKQKRRHSIVDRRPSIAEA